MEGVKHFKQLFREIMNMTVTFFKPYELIDSMLEIPPQLYKAGIRNGLIHLITTIISLMFTFALKASNYCIEQKWIILGIVLFLLYLSQSMAKTHFYSIEKLNKQKFEEILDNTLMSLCAKILGAVNNKVEQYDNNQKCYKVMLNRTIINKLKRYLNKFWYTRTSFIFNILNLLNIFIMLVFTIYTNTHIPSVFFVPIIILFVIITFVCKAYDIVSSKSYRQVSRRTDDETSALMDDLIKSPLIVKQDLAMRLSRLNKSLSLSTNSSVQYRSKLNKSQLLLSGIETVTNFSIVFALLYGIDFNSVSLSTIPELLATIVIAETALHQVRDIAFVMGEYYDVTTHLKEEEQDVVLILETYHKEIKHATSVNKINNLSIEPFSISYTEQSENDKPFTLVSNEKISIANGEIVILSGPSGSGKSTFMKVITERIRLEKSDKLPSTNRFIFYDETLALGSLSIFDELFCDEKEPNLSKMQNILENMNLWSEINANCKDIWQWFKEKSYSKSLSNGQKQRLILSKLLYWLDDNIDVVALDECTSGLDVTTPKEFADAERILEYIVRFCNQDKKRIILISTHQDISGFVNKLSNEYKFRNLLFGKVGNQNIVSEI